MPSQQKKKIDYPGDHCIVSAWAYKAGLSRDRSGLDALNAWGNTATPEELDWLLGPVGPNGERQEDKGYAYSLGVVAGLATMPLWARFWRWLFS